MGAGFHGGFGNTQGAKDNTAISDKVMLLMLSNFC